MWTALSVQVWFAEAQRKIRTRTSTNERRRIQAKFSRKNDQKLFNIIVVMLNIDPDQKRKKYWKVLEFQDDLMLFVTGTSSIAKLSRPSSTSRSTTKAILSARMVRR